MLVPILLAGGALALYEIFKPKGPKPGSPKPSGATAQPLSLNLKNLVQKVVPGSAQPSQSSATSSTAVNDPVAAAASFAGNAILHGAPTDPAVMAAVKAFQVAAGGLVADGKYGPKTQAALAHYVGNAPPAPAIYGGTG